MSIKNRRKDLLRQFLFRRWQVLMLAPGTAVVTAALNCMGIFQVSEWAVLDSFFRWRPLEPVDCRIVVVTIDDEDITKVGRWPISDDTLAKVLLKVKQQQPRVIGLDLYRDLPVEPGQQALTNLFRSTPYLVAVQKRFGDRRVPPPPVLGQLNQTALADLVIDSDGTVRRGLLSAKDKTSGELYIGLAARAALSYLAAKGIKPEPLDELGNRLKLGQAQFQALHKDDGGYVGVDANGYQILLNFRGQQKNFQTVSLTQVLFDQIPRNLFRDRIVFIGTTAESIKDFFYTPYDNNREAQFPGMAGVFIHANLSSQILSAALDERHPVRFIPNSLEWLWAAIWSVAGVLISWHSLQTLWIGRKWLYGVAIVYLVLAGVGLLVISYLLFLEGWWVPVIPALVGLTLSAITYFGLHSQSLQRLAYFDGLTQVANRRYFDQRLARQVHIKGHLSLMLCDVDYFKLYNDAYGHQAGDACLQKVAVAIRNAVRRTDLVARYGGEEFAVILPHTNPEAASRIAERVLNEVRSLQLPHIKSLVADHVTLSCGVVSVEVNDQQLRSRDWSTASLIAKADEALYICKREGRDRFTVKGF